jgi:peptide/nickel transport system permease protein
MTGYIVRRLLQAVIVVIGVTLLTFLLQHLIPGNIARAIVGPRATASQIAEFNREWGLNRPLPLQYASFLNQLAHGNLGYSYKQNRSVDSMVVQYLPRDVMLGGVSLILAVLIAVPIGLTQAVRRNKAADYVGTGVSFVLYSMPEYWLAFLLIAGLSISVRLLPPQAPQGNSLAAILAHPSGLVLPIATLTLITFALFSRYMRSSAIDTLNQDYIRTARAKGLSERWIRYRHVLRNSLLPIATLIGLQLPWLVTSVLVVEYVFNFQGLGLQYYNAALNSDYPVELGITVLVGVLAVVGNLFADIAYAVLDPRVRYRNP